MILVGVRKPREPEWMVDDSIAELAELAVSARATVLERFICRPRKASPATFIGKGKTEELRDRAQALGAAAVIFDDDLTPVQARNIEEIAGVRVVDRTQVILDIFAQRAQTREGQLQIELAQLEYMLPRLRGTAAGLDQQKGGIGLRGPGEKKLELDRRRVELKIDQIRLSLEQVRSRREELRRGRRRHGWALVCLVGYTNVGKSTLLNALSGARIYTDDKLFATLDPTTRRIDLPNNQPALLTDTVGFIRKLPTHLVEAFKATLEEVVRADLLIHVIDASHPLAEQQIDAVEQVLRDLGAHERPRIDVLNKTDRPEATARAARLAPKLRHPVPISALTGEGLDALRTELADLLRERSVPFAALIPLSDGRTQAILRQSASIEEEEYTEEGLRVSGRIPARLLGAVTPFLIPGGADDEPGAGGERDLSD